MALLLTGIVALMAAQTGSGAETVDVRAHQAFQFFSQFCVASNGSRERAMAVLGDGNALAKRLPATTTDALLRQTGTVGWAVRSPGGAGLMLGYGDKNHCELRVQESDEGTLVRDFEALQMAINPEPGNILKAKSRVEGGVTRTMRGFKFRQGSFIATVALTTSDKREGEQQHFLTFDMPTN